ncbi:multiheme c-type cytochrome [Candidatus Thioglobus sp.]|uniref:multiheme c-type cytochrome n=1 Tax=Candidatus Thioglobus sp. TaxID=2026721 RepID=UPI003D0F2B3D
MKKIILTLLGIVAIATTFNTLYASTNSVGINKDVAGLDVKPTAERPFAPSMLRTKDNNHATLESFENPETCAGCHPKQYEGWRGSMHSHSWNDPIFQAEFKKGLNATDGKIFNLCAGCHSPIGVLTGTVSWDKKTNEFTVSEKAARGVTCDVCHSISGAVPLKDTITSEHGNGSHIIDTGSHIKYGPLKNSESPYHQTQYSELHTKANLCASCHNIIHPVNGTPIERTYDEWRVSPYAQNEIVCQDCHMNSVEVAIEVAKTLKRPEELEGFNLSGKASTLGVTDHSVVHPHEFVGGNTIVTAMLEPDSLRKRQHSEIAKKRLQNAAELKVDLSQRKDGLFNLNVDVYNVGAGHNIPTSLTQVRHIWIEATISDDQGNVLFETGKLNDHHDLDEEETIIFRTWTVDADGNDTHDPWAINHLVRDTTIPPKGHSKHDFVFSHTNGGKIKVDVKLNYRSATQHFIESLLGKDAPTIPTIHMQHVIKTYVQQKNSWQELGKKPSIAKEKDTHH